MWFIFNGRLSLETALTGIVVCGAIYGFLCRFIGYDIKKDISSLKKIHIFIAFLLTLFLNIAISNFIVIKIILSPNKKPNSEIVSFNPRLKNFNTRCIYAEAITITPGTYTVGLKNGEYQVHSLTPRFSKQLTNSAVLRYIKSMEDKL